MFDISFRANINHKLTSMNEVVIFEDHRTILNVLFYLKEKRKLTEPLDIIMFDNHDDFCNPRTDALKKISNFLKNPSLQKLYPIIEFDLGPLDDDWVKVGMELNLIGNVFLFNSDECSISKKEDYKTKKFGTKRLYNLGNVWSALGYHGILNDPVKTYNQDLWDDLGWDFKNGKFKIKENRNPFIFDIDLDCFSIQILDKTIAIPDEVIIPKLTEPKVPSYHYYYSSAEFMKDLIKKSEIVTLCYENGCCGGIRQSQKIFKMVDYVLFDNELSE